MLKCIRASSFLLLACFLTASAQNLNISFIVHTQKDTGLISPYIYGSNGQSDDRAENITARRLGGNRMTGYNWENNASNAGNDWYHSSDNYMVSQLPANQRSIPGIVVKTFHDESVISGCYSLITLQAAGYVAADVKGTVSEAEKAPSARWKAVSWHKPSAFVYPPDLTDQTVYMDEQVKYYITEFGQANETTGIRAYAVDNEPCLWSSTHPRIHPTNTRCQEIIDKAIEAGLVIKNLDPRAELFGPVLFGFSSYNNFQSAPDWNQFSSYKHFIAAYLAKMKEAENKHGKRLLDVLSINWYPEATGKNAQNQDVRVTENNTDPGVAEARVQAPRAFWDASYKETSWIGQWYGPNSGNPMRLPLLPIINSAIVQYDPGARLAITEFNYGAENHISGGLAVADLLGVFGKYGVYFASHWGALDGYVSAAYKLYRNYDEDYATFANLKVYTLCSDNVNASLYASRPAGAAGPLHLIVLNKNRTKTIQGLFTIQGGWQYLSGESFAFASGQPEISSGAAIPSIVNNGFSYDLAPWSAHHLVLQPATETGVASVAARPQDFRLTISPNPLHGNAGIAYDLVQGQNIVLRLYNHLGQQLEVLYEGYETSGLHRRQFTGKNLAAGVYFVQLQTSTASKSVTFSILR